MTRTRILHQVKDYLKSKKFIFSVLGIVLLFTGWQIAAFFVHDIVLASPTEAIKALFKMGVTPRFQQAFAESLLRMVLGISLGGFAGFILGIFAGLNEPFKYLLEPVRWMVMSISPVIVVVIAMLWFGLGTKMVVIISAFLLAPIVYVNTMKGIEMVDDNIIEMTNVYKFSLWQKLRHVYLPALTGPLAAAMTIVVTTGTRMIILAEILGTNSGIGYELSLARSELNTPELYAWVLVPLIVVGVAEFLIFKPIENYFLRWRN